MHKFGMTVDCLESKLYHRCFTVNFTNIFGTSIEEHAWLSVSEYKNRQPFGLC